MEQAVVVSQLVCRYSHSCRLQPNAATTHRRQTTPIKAGHRTVPHNIQIIVHVVVSHRFRGQPRVSLQSSWPVRAVPKLGLGQLQQRCHPADNGGCVVGSLNEVGVDLVHQGRRFGFCDWLDQIIRKIHAHKEQGLGALSEAARDG